MKRIALALLASFAFAATAAHAVEYGKVQPDKSRIAFDYQQMGVAMQGTFGKFVSELRFDPAAPQSASARIEVDLASVDTGSEEGDEEVALPLTIARTNSAEISTRVQDVAARLSISQVLDKYPYQMSGGQQQRVAAARALVTDPTMIMADEPTGALDSKSARLLLESLEALNRRLRATVLMVTHDSFAASYTSRVLFIRDGKIFTELRRGDTDRREFFDRIMEVVAMMGGEGSDAL